MLRALVLLAVVTGGCAADDREQVSADAAQKRDTSEVAESGSVEVEPGPIGGGLASGTGLDVDLECPAGVEADTTEWFGPAGLSMEGAVKEGYGDLVVGWIGDPELLEETADWATWGLRLEDGSLIAAVTVVATGTGWDPSHAAFCVIRAPQPPAPPLTFYVSNQSFDDPTVGITVTLDGNVIVDESFDVEGQHNWKRFDLDLPAGEHELRAMSDNGVVFDTRFISEANQPVWAVLNYWWHPTEPRQFTFATSDEPMAFG